MKTQSAVNRKIAFPGLLFLSCLTINAQVSVLNPIKVFPNPSDKRFSIDFNLDKQEDGIISIIETGTGRIIFTEKLLSFSGQYHKVFTKAMVPKGTYIITLKTNEGLQTKQFIME